MLTTFSWGQEVVVPKPQLVDIDAINELYNLDEITGVTELKPNKYFKLSFKPDLNKDLLLLVNQDNGADMLVQNLDENDYINFLRYDFRVKIYVTDYLRLSGGVMVNGMDSKNYTYRFGVMYRF